MPFDFRRSENAATIWPCQLYLLPLAFEFCEGGTCGDARPSADNKSVSCPQSDKCAAGGCYCQLFKRRKNSPDTTPWDIAHEDHAGKTKYRPADLDYKCFCVKPILEGELTSDGVTYKVRYQLCGLGSCGKVDVEVVDPNGKHHEIKCTGNCEGECKCTLSRLQVAGGGWFKPENAKWDLVAKADTQVRHDDRYIYRCFCLK